MHINIILLIKYLYLKSNPIYFILFYLLICVLIKSKTISKWFIFIILQLSGNLYK